MQNIVLIGFMGSGKTTIGAYLAKCMGHYFIDTDVLIAMQSALSVKEIFECYGEEYFRKQEACFIQWASSHLSHAVIATGGGMPIFNSIKALGKVFYLKLDFQTIQTRLSLKERTSRPLFAHPQKAYELYQSRIAAYAQCADYTIEADRSIEEIATEILKHSS
ncbi:hypothetical protein BKH46_01750 [Helicobacter sp. 12S02634-8]|uniref:shikimate kinase n=1 Tax=Helicobacter sp. 12S02634-8 TaxID=1476199 RepID=UPI000BA7651E|nr:shikimate kinase [Helicobacter sp. 12S02634-8]PAF48059.1 hypothetical protein BKH46_01750 [Helicobacter sp. 12S02634-8]